MQRFLASTVVQVGDSEYSNNEKTPSHLRFGTGIASAFIVQVYKQPIGLFAMARLENCDSGRALRQLDAMAELDDNAIRELSSIAQLEIYPAGTILFSEGDNHDRIYFVCEGLVALNMVTANCGRQTILSAGSGDLLAWSALVGNRFMTTTAVVSMDARLVAFPAEELKKLLEGNFELGYRMMRIVATALARRLLATRLQLLDLYHL